MPFEAQIQAVALSHPAFVRQPLRLNSNFGSPLGRFPCACLGRSPLPWLLFLVLAFPAAAQTSAPETGPCSLAQAAPTTVALIDDDFDLLLDDGRRLALAGLEFPQGEGEAAKIRAAALALLSGWLVGNEVFIEPLALSPDRWSHVPAQAIAPAAKEPQAPLVSVGAALLSEGLARFRPDRAALPCAKSYLAAEAPARAQSRGIWAIEPAFDLSAPSKAQLAALARKKGMVAVFGVVRSIGETKTALYLNFGARRGEDFAVVIFKSNVAIFEKNGVFPRSLAGRRIGVRGLIDWINGPRMEISSPAEVEIFDGDPSRR